MIKTKSFIVSRFYQTYKNQLHTMRARNSQRTNTNHQQSLKQGSYPSQAPAKANQLPAIPSDHMQLSFMYSFQDYLKMALCKMVPQEGVLFNQREGYIFGPREECIRLKKKVEKELNSRKYKKIEFKKGVDLDEIDYELDAKFQARIFRQGFINRALTAIQDYDGLEKACDKFRKAIGDGRTIILRVKSDFEEECMEKIDQILKGKAPVMEKAEEEEVEVQVEDEANYYQVMKEKAVQPQKMLQELNESKISEESSFTLTQTDSSQLMEEEGDSLTMGQPDKVNKSFA